MAGLKIIVTGDDLGHTIDVNNNIEYCHHNGILSSASLFANGESFDDAVKIALRNPKLGVGVHLAIDEVDPLCKDLSSIINPETNLFYTKKVANKKARTFKYRESDLIKEYSLQIEKVLDSGISITHLDHHHHYHLYWPLLNAIVTVAKKYHIRYIRSQCLILSNKNLYNKIYRIGHQLFLKRNASTTDGYYDFDSMHKEFDKMYERFNKLVNSNYKIVEVVSHPCKKNDHEVAFLTNKKVINLVKSCHVNNFGNI